MIVLHIRVCLIFGYLTGGTKLLGKYSKEANIIIWIVIIAMGAFLTVFCLIKIMEIFNL